MRVVCPSRRCRCSSSTTTTTTLSVDSVHRPSRPSIHPSIYPVPFETNKQRELDAHKHTHTQTHAHASVHTLAMYFLLFVIFIQTASPPPPSSSSIHGAKSNGHKRGGNNDSNEHQRMQDVTQITDNGKFPFPILPDNRQKHTHTVSQSPGHRDPPIQPSIHRHIVYVHYNQ